MKKLLLIDAYALIFRAYYAFIRNPRYTSKGFNTSAIFGFTNTLIDILENESSSHVAVVFDAPGKNFRHDMYVAYKANRPPTPEDIKNAIPYIKNIIDGFNIPVKMIDNYEADDVIGTLAKLASEQGFRVNIITPDKDFIQLITDKINVLKPTKRGSSENNLLDIPAIKNLYAIENPKQFIDILGLMGDSVDNVPGCPGVGPKTAQKLIEQYRSIEGVYENITQLKGRQKEILLANKEKVFLSKKLVTIATDVPVKFDLTAYDKNNISREKLLPVFRELEFRMLTERVIKLTSEGNAERSLFDVLGDTESLTIQNFAKSNLNCYEMDTPALQADLRADLCIQKKFAFSLLFTDENPITTNVNALSFSFDNDTSFFVSLPDDFNITKEKLQRFRFIFEDETIEKITFNQKKAIIFLHRCGLKLKGKLFDLALSHYVIHPEQNHGLPYISQTLLNYHLLEEKSNSQARKNYCCERSSVYLRLYEVLKQKMHQDKLTDLYEKLEVPLIRVLADMEIEGVKIDTQVLKEYSREIKLKISEISKNIYELAGNTSFNISSPKQLGQILFQKLGLDPKAKKTKSGQFSTSEAVLVKLKDKHPIISEILQFRMFTKLLNTYVDALPAYINKESRKIHTQFVQTEAVTGRLSSKYPNLQNIPIRTEEGRKIRKAFIPSSKKNVFLSADYSQIELRLMAHLSGDENMINAFKNKEDIHASTAAKIYKVALENVTSQMRYKAKTANFGIIYGISAWGLAERLNISRTDSKLLINSYFETYPRVKAYMKSCIEKARKDRFVETIMGRKRHLPDINSKNSFVRSFAERNAINTPIQGSAADIIKIAMIKIHSEMLKENLQSRMILQVHDELNFDCLKTEREKLQKIIISAMENAVKLKVPLLAEIDSGTNWLEAH